MHRHLRFLLPLWLLALLATALSIGAGPAQAATTTSVTADGPQGGRTFTALDIRTCTGGANQVWRRG